MFFRNCCRDTRRLARNKSERHKALLQCSKFLEAHSNDETVTLPSGFTNDWRRIRSGLTGILLNLSTKVAPADAQVLGGAGMVAASLFQDAQDVTTFKFFERAHLTPWFAGSHLSSQSDDSWRLRM
jgi:hypothetical protein